MNRKLICLLLCGAMLLALAGCGAAAKEEPTPEPVQEATPAPTAAPTPAPPTPSPTPEPTPVAYSFADAYLRYLAVFSAVTDELERRIETHNAILESQYPDSYYMNSNYLMQVYIPFRPAYPALGSSLADDRLAQAQESLRAVYPDAQLALTSPGVYEATFTYTFTDPNTEEETVRHVRCVWECDAVTGAFRVRAWQDEALTEFTEFIPQDGDRYLIYTMNDKILTEVRDGVVLALQYGHRISEAPLGTFPGDMRLCSLEEADFYPSGTAGEDWIVADPDAQYVLVLEVGEMVFTGKISQDILDARGSKVGVAWQDIDPIHLLKQ